MMMSSIEVAPEPRIVNCSSAPDEYYMVQFDLANDPGHPLVQAMPVND